MKNLLILIVAIAVFLHFYPQPEVDQFYQEQKESLMAIFSEATETSAGLNLSTVTKDIEALFPTFRKSEKKHTLTIIESKKSVKAFYSTHCTGKALRDKKLHVDNQEKICRTLKRYSRFMN
jgi:hypothetical protein